MKQAEKLLRGVNTQINRAIRSQGVDEMHDLRVAIRRLTRILVVLKRCFPRDESRKLRRGLKQIMTQAGDVRNYDIAVTLLEKTTLSEGSPLAGSAALVEEFRRRREKAAQVITATLGRWATRNLAGSWREAVRSAAGSGKPAKGSAGRFCATPIGVAARGILADMVGEYFRSGRDASRGGAPSREIHEFRIAAKNFRYTLDSFEPLYGRSLSPLTGQLKDVQTALGHINDIATVRRMLAREQAAYKKDGTDMDCGEILSGFRKRQRRKTEQFRQRYAAEFSSPDVLRQWQERVRHIGVHRARKRAPTGTRQPS